MRGGTTTVSIIVPNFNGAQLLEKNLPHVLAAQANEVIVIDDGSTDDSKNVLKNLASQTRFVKLIINEKNIGYGASVNRGVMEAKGDLFVLLNTDTRPEPDFLQAILPHFDNTNVFAVSCREPGRSWARGEFRDGFFHHEPGLATDHAHISLYASGGSAAFSKEKFMRLGMYDSLYHPFYWEDTDISYRAWKRGWEVWWEPNAVVEHDTSSTIKKYFSNSFVEYIAQRNELLFTWKNITDHDLFSQHKRALQKRIRSHPGYLKPFLGALKNVQRIRKSRYQEIAQLIRTDKEIFDLFR